MAKLFSARIKPMDEWILVRIATEAKSKVLLAERSETGSLKVSSGPTKRNHGIVVAVGPGTRDSAGNIVKIDPDIRPGATVCFPGKVAFRPEDFAAEMEEEGLYFLPASTVVFVLTPEMGRAAVSA